MKSKTLLLAIILIALSVMEKLWAQEVATLTGKVTLQSTVVRQYTNEQSVYYCSDLSGNNYFVLYDSTNSTSARVAQFPNYLEVHDFEIYNDWVYFCGTYPQSGNPWGMVGQIKISELFYSNGPYSIGYLNLFFVDMVPVNAHLTSCDRMDVFEENGDIHFAIVGEMEHTAVYGNALRRTVCDVWLNGSVWQGSALYQKDDVYKTSDITCTDGCVVVSAYDNSLSYGLLLVFKKTTNFPSIPLFPYTVKLMDRRYDNNILVERLMDNDVAVAHYYHDIPSSKKGVAVHHINNVTSLPTPSYHFSLHFSQGTGVIKSVLRDLRYNKSEDALLLLHDMEAPFWSVWRSTLFDFKAYNLAPLLANAWHYSDNVSLLTVDNRSSAYSFSLGGNYLPLSEPLLTIRDKINVGCYQSMFFSYDDVTSYVSFLPGTLDDTYMTCTRPSLGFYPNPISTPVTIICEQTVKDHE